MRRESRALDDSPNVSQQISVAEHDALGLAGGTGRKLNQRCVSRGRPVNLPRLRNVGDVLGGKGSLVDHGAGDTQPF